MKLQSNQSAPIFAVPDIYGRQVNLESYRDKKIFLGFFRHAGCPFCNLRVHTLTKIHQDMKDKGLEMIFFFESKASVLLRSSFHTGVSPIPLIADPTKNWYTQYGLEPSTSKAVISHLSSFVQTAFKASGQKLPTHMMKSGEAFNTMPAEFLIDKNLVIKEVYYSDRLNDRMDVSKIEQFAIA
ncbi:redoxin domain-containing protein [Pseudochryseolinea flava]|uniref:AhpC/TSA family protein n=1 Tax=Pseudochryseolinea flava TaxID=2059302 RepID=A0A364Y0B9_9BACT|nr:redoxin domain-containing protein [Pseudochryseolinea flava]RAW00095.1 AhpC/TSA family protein [Pseudochryseolinea flava]